MSGTSSSPADSATWYEPLDTREDGHSPWRLSAAGHTALKAQAWPDFRAALPSDLDPWPQCHLDWHHADGRGLPTALSLQTSDRSAELLLWVDGQLPCFDGHFPQQPILPGVAQLDWAGRAASALFGLPLGCRELRRIKFSNPAGPDTTLILQIERRQSAVNFECRTAAGLHAKGSLVYDN